jgi:hypothetical protein
MYIGFCCPECFVTAGLMLQPVSDINGNNEKKILPQFQGIIT